MFRTVIASLVDLLVPPRRAERRVHTLTLQDVQMLAHEDGLPYRDPVVRDLVWEIKYYGSGHAAKLAGEYLADELLALAAEELGVPLLIPIPMHPTRRKERGHNQTEVLCEAALRALGQGESPFEYKKGALKRVVDTPHQQGLARNKRLKNVEGSMIAQGVEGRVCVVVDDVTTTGATLAEAKRALLGAGARRVHSVALARS
jgi:ComF family protein